ncbi:MAG: fluoride efflux transporter CrcB [bacterium]|nr:fluoride efflux transporter CrcB [bacterium]
MSGSVLKIAYVGLGGCVGAIMRYSMSVLLQRYVESWPVGTLVVNVTGCFVLGVVIDWSERVAWLTPEMRLLFATGFCGGFTTMSSFVYELLEMVRSREYYYAMWYGGGTVVGSCVSFVAGRLAWSTIMAGVRVLWN